MSIERRLIRRAAVVLRNSLVESCVAELSRMQSGLSGDDSGLDTAWEEICVQVQDEESFFWDAYMRIISDCIAAGLAKLPRSLRDVLSAATDEGDDWLDEPDDDGVVPMFEDEIINMVRSELLARADEYDNEAIQQFKAAKGECE